MYNKYLQAACPPQPPASAAPAPPPCVPPEGKPEPDGGLLSSLGSLFGKDGGLSRLFEHDTLLVLLILFFLLKDEDGKLDHDLLLLAGVFLLIGL